MAERSRLSADTIRRLEHGAFSPSLDTLLKLCDGLGLRMSTLFESLEIGELDQSRNLLDLISTFGPKTREMADAILRAMAEAESKHDESPAAE